MKLFLSLFFLCAGTWVHGQDSVQTAANKAYDQAGGFKRLMLGHHYRKDWAAEIHFRVLNLDTTAGGLTPLKLGGGHQTKSLRLLGEDGKQYVLRSVNKDPSKTLPPELVGSFADDVVQDQISSANPYAPLLVSALAEAAGVRHIPPRMVYVPASERLGEYEKEFAGTVCIFEERPNANDDDIVNTEKLQEKLNKHPDHRVDERAFLKARLFDIWIGDWDRHEDQWVWLALKKGDKTIYEPIPRDRDQAFAKLDGVIPYMATRKWAIRNTQNFGYTITDVPGLIWSGRILDRSFTTELTLHEWLQVAQELQDRLTDEVIEESLQEFPPAIYALSGKEIGGKLKRRRNDLLKYARAYYSFLAAETDITGTRKPEIFTVKRIDNDSTLVTVSSDSKLIYQRVFLRGETKEIRLYGLDGNDRFEIEGETGRGILVRVIGGEGEDTVMDRSFVGAGGHKTKVYDQPNTVLQAGKETRIFISNDSLKNVYQPRANRYDWFGPKFSPGYNPDDGIYIGGGFTFKKQRFGKTPYGYLHSVWGNYAIATGAWNFWYKGIFREAVGKWDLHLDATINAPNYVRNFYGLGNETIKTKEDWSYYRVRTNQIILTPSIYREFAGKHAVEFGVSGQSMKVERTANRFITDSHDNDDDDLFDRKYYANGFAAYSFSTLDNTLYPRKGFRVVTRGDYTMSPDEGKGFAKLLLETSGFLSAGSLTLALRGGVATNLDDDFEFFQANTLGGNETLRGYRRDRYTGKTRLFGNSEIRCRLRHAQGYIFRGDYGLFAFFDDGRVWMPGENSETWHCGYGGGIFFLAYNRLPFTVAYAASKEEGMVVVKAGFLF